MKLLEKLINLNGISGDEADLRNFIFKEAKKYCKNVIIDKIGNVVAKKNGIRPSVILMAHMDEIGLMVSSIENDGKIHVSTIGNIDTIILIGHRVEIKTKKGIINGIITTRDILNATQGPKKINLDSLFVYTGLTKEMLTKLGIGVGTYINFSKSSQFCNLGNKNIIAGKALDDRIGCYILLELLKKLKTKHEVIFVFTVQEEMGLYGAKASSFNLKSDYAIIVDVTNQVEDDDKLILGKGPSLMIKDAQMIGNKLLNDAIKETAKKIKIDLQLEVSETGTTDATSIFAENGGTPSAVLGVPVANLHTTLCAADMSDIDNAIKLLNEFLKKPTLKK